MSLHPASDSSVPDDTAAVARAVFPQGTACLRLRNYSSRLDTDIVIERGMAASGWA